MDKDINNTKSNIATIELKEEDHKFPGITIKYRFDQSNRIVHVFVNNLIVATYTDNYSLLVWNKLIGEEHKNENLFTTEMIINKAAIATGIEYDEIFTHNRHTPIVFARQMAMWKIYNIIRPSPSYVASIFPGFDHATVLWAVKKMSKDLKYFSDQERTYLNKFLESLMLVKK